MTDNETLLGMIKTSDENLQAYFERPIDSVFLARGLKMTNRVLKFLIENQDELNPNMPTSKNPLGQP